VVSPGAASAACLTVSFKAALSPTIS